MKKLYFEPSNWYENLADKLVDITLLYTGTKSRSFVSSLYCNSGFVLSGIGFLHSPKDSLIHTSIGVAFCLLPTISKRLYDSNIAEERYEKISNSFDSASLPTKTVSSLSSLLGASILTAGAITNDPHVGFVGAGLMSMSASDIASSAHPRVPEDL